MGISEYQLYVQPLQKAKPKQPINFYEQRISKENRESKGNTEQKNREIQDQIMKKYKIFIFANEPVPSLISPTNNILGIEILFCILFVGEIRLGQKYCPPFML
jgi:uncharacterized short protein YbdD (DUF466 family)